MINTNYVEKAGFTFGMLSEDQIEEILRSALEIMRTVGFTLLHAEARKMMHRAGAMVKDDRVKVPEHIVRYCLSQAPKGWTIFDRNGNRALDVTGRKSYYGTATAAPNTMDAFSGRVRPTQLDDIRNGARIADGLPNIDFVMPFGSSQDVPGQACDIYEFPVVVANTTKPIVFISYSGRGVELVYEMAAAVAGGLDQLQERPFVVAYPEPIAPLVYPEAVVNRLFAAADLMMPQIPAASVMLGATGPVTIAGGVVQAVAESLFSLSLAQLRKPGCPVAMSTGIGIMDMTSGLSIFGVPTKSTGICVHAQVAQHLDLPTWGLAGATDSKRIDAQAGLEAMFHVMAQAMAGLNLIHDVGYIDSAMCCSPQQLVMGNDIVGMVKHFMQGVVINHETLAREVIEAVGPGGHFLNHPHTLKHFREQIWSSPLMNRRPRQQWEQDGSKDLSVIVQEEVVRILESHQPEPLDDKIVDQLERIRIKGEMELVPA
ncbi:MAG: trimethylamine methyltransferase family protein [Desulfosarcina sp.]|jgi:trimethylamine--corrinoid protein Co-methyltransferase